MQLYRDWDNDSGIKAFEIGRDYITVEFKYGNNRFYKYTYARPGISNVEEMKRLALVGDGLNEFIGNRRDYESKW